MKKLIVSFVQYFVIIGSLGVFSYYYDKINNDIPNSLSTLSTASSVNLALQLLFGIICSLLINKIGYWFSSLFAFLFVGGAYIATSFINDINLIYLTYGVLCAIGYSMLITMCISMILNEYGDSPKFSIIYGFCSLGASCGLISGPFIVQYLDIGLHLPWRENMRYVGLGICFLGFIMCFFMNPCEKPLIKTLDITNQNANLANETFFTKSLCYLVKNYKYILCAISVSIYGTIHNVFYTYIIIYLTHNNENNLNIVLAVPIVGISSIFGKIITGYIAKLFPRLTYFICLICVSVAYFILASYKSPNIYIISSLIGFFGESSFICYSSAMLTTIDVIYANYANGLTLTIRSPITIGLFIGLSYIQSIYGYNIMWIVCGSITIFTSMISLITFL